MTGKILAFIFFIVTLSVNADTECFGEGEYRVCTELKTFSDGTTAIRAYDTQGYNYSVESGCQGNTCYSRDSEGYEYSIKSWCDKTGCHSLDNEGNKCTITHAGEMIGCD